MTEKKQRFTIEPTMMRECILDNTTGEQLDTIDYTERLCDLLNELNQEAKDNEHYHTVVLENYKAISKENEQLKKHREELFYRERDAKNDWRKLKYENELLKRRNKGLQSELQIFKEDVKHSNLQINKLADENEQLKQLAEGNEELLLKVMSYLHDNHYDIWEEVNKECFLKELV